MPQPINTVFTPRQHEVNKAIYITRPYLELALGNALTGAMHILIYGDSGCGKTWLYKKVLNDEKIKPVVANFANASRMQSLTQEFERLANAIDPIYETGYKETKGASVKIPVASGKLEHEAEYKIRDEEPFHRLLRLMSKPRGKRVSVLVIDNLEKIVAQDALMRELGDIITLCDDESYAKFNVRLMIVGVPRDVRAYFSKTLNQETVANRLLEIPEVTGMSHDLTQQFVHLGFVSMLDYKLTPQELKTWSKEIFELTMGIPQSLHELCYEIAIFCELREAIPKDAIKRASVRWVQRHMNQKRTVLETAMNKRNMKHGRRNQVLYALGRMTTESFAVSQVERAVRDLFKGSTQGLGLNVSDSLKRFARMREPLLRAGIAQGTYTFEDKRYQMVIRALLRVKGETVTIAPEERDLPFIPSTDY